MNQFTIFNGFLNSALPLYPYHVIEMVVDEMWCWRKKFLQAFWLFEPTFHYKNEIPTLHFHLQETLRVLHPIFSLTSMQLQNSSYTSSTFLLKILPNSLSPIFGNTFNLLASSLFLANYSRFTPQLLLQPSTDLQHSIALSISS